MPTRKTHLLNTYKQNPLSFTHGSGCWLYDKTGNAYLDALCGIAVTGLGHNYPAVTKAIQDQAAKTLHTSNFFEIESQIELAAMLAEHSGLEKAFFCNSGAEAVEGLIKLSRLYAHARKIQTPKIIVFNRAFHGRTMGALSVKTSTRVYHGYEPLLPGFIQVPYNDLNALERVAQQHQDIVAILMEPIQGEGGIQVPDTTYLNEIRSLCTKFNWLMLLDEVQSGIGRTGKLFAYQHNAILPDAICLAKGLGNGIPIGAFLVAKPYCDLFKPGMHGSTFGGNPLATRVAKVVISEILEKGYLENAKKQGDILKQTLTERLKNHPEVVAVRGKGLMIGIELSCDAQAILPLALKAKILFNITQKNILRILPPLIVGEKEVETILEVIPTLIETYLNLFKN